MSIPKHRCVPYKGRELSVFARATHWKSYWAAQTRPYLFGDVLEVGAGCGASTEAVFDPNCRRWVCLEPDPKLAQRLADGGIMRRWSSKCEVFSGTTADLPQQKAFDTILYIDVLEHIADDRAEIHRAKVLLRRGGRIVILAPAHQWLFSDFDESIGHCRRYSRRMLRDLLDKDFICERLLYLDSAGLCASLGNRLCLRRSLPTEEQIWFWGHVLVRCSTVLDRLFLGAIGKSVLGIWRKELS